MAINFLKLYRLDVFFIFILLFIFGAGVAVNFSFINFNYLYNFFIAFLISFISVNFIYSLNSWFDADVDKINKPNRPIPSGLISKKQAFIYSIILGVISFIYPFILFYNSNIKFLFFIFIISGILYSNKTFSFKKNRYSSLGLISLNVILTTFLGYIANGGNLNNIIIFITIIILLFLCLAVIPMKDLSDVKGDRAYKLDNWFFNKKNKILFFSIILLILCIILSFYVTNYILLIISISPFLLFLLFYIFNINSDKFYNVLLKIFVLEGMLCLIYFILAP